MSIARETFVKFFLKILSKIGPIGLMIMSLIWIVQSCPVFAAGKVSLRVAPLAYDLVISPGEQKSGQIFIENISDQDLEISTEFSDFFIDEDGNYLFPGEKDGPATEKYKLFSMRDWIRADKNNFALNKAKSEVINYTIQVPVDANLGGHYGAVFFRSSCQLDGNQAVVSTDKSRVCVSARPGVLFLVQAGGEAQKSGKLKRAEIPGISFRNKETLNIELENTGNVHFKPEGEILAKNLFGKEVFQLDIKDKTLLPGTSRQFSGTVERKDFLGVYRIIGSVRDGDGNEMRLKKWIFLVPWKEFLAILALVAVWIWFLRKYRVSKKKK